jgi:hypothetical protein
MILTDERGTGLGLLRKRYCSTAPNESLPEKVKVTPPRQIRSNVHVDVQHEGAPKEEKIIIIK